MDIAFDRFRCFGDPQTARIAPITILAGENSAGKSTFMAGLRYVLDFTGFGNDPSFNKDPFFLGGYKSIAHYRGGKYGRAPQFKIGITEAFSESRLRPRDPDMFGHNEAARTISVTLTFTSVNGDAIPTEYEITTQKKTIRISLDGNSVKALLRDGDFEHQLTTRHASRLLTSRSDFVTLEYFLRDAAMLPHRSSAELSVQDRRAAQIAEEIWSTFRHLGTRRTSQVIALAPVRTRPLRSYDPTQLSQSSEGDQLIAKLGRLARVDVAAWEKIKTSLERYGSATGLFEAITIKKLGRGEADPFQIFIRSSGRETNIIDVGYGISQVLPLFIMLSELDKKSTLLIQQPEVHLHPTAQAALGTVITETIAKQRGPSLVVETHSDFIIDRIKMGVRDKIVRAEDVEILFFEKKQYNSLITRIRLGEDGEILDPPPSYREFFLKENIKIMGY